MTFNFRPHPGITLARAFSSLSQDPFRDFFSAGSDSNLAGNRETETNREEIADSLGG